MTVKNGKAPKRPDFIRHWRDIEDSRASSLPFERELHGTIASFSEHGDLRRLLVQHERLEPGYRSSAPYAERDEEEMTIVLEGTPDLWSDGWLYRCGPGEAAMFPERTGHAHAFLNNSEQPVRLLTIREQPRQVSKRLYALSTEGNKWLQANRKLWTDAPKIKLGPHDGLTDRQRGTPTPAAQRKKGMPKQATHWSAIIGKDDSHYPGQSELHGYGAPLAQWGTLTRIGVHYEVLEPGRRTSYPHAEYDEEEFCFVIDGAPDVWIDGWLHPLRAGEGVSFPDRTGIAHAFINNSGERLHLIVVGEASRRRSKCTYPTEPAREAEIGEGLWTTAPKRKLGRHDGLPDALRAARAKIRRQKK